MDDVAVVMLVIGIILSIVVFVAFILSVDLLINLAKKKGYYKNGESTGLLWFIGIFATPLVVGLYVVGLPEKRTENPQSTDTQRSFDSSISDDLPAL